VAIGGWDGARNLASLETLAPAARAFEPAPSPLSSARRGAAAAALDGSVYVIGGWDGLEYLRSVEVLDAAPPLLY
jgi:hypothetical protein